MTDADLLARYVSSGSDEAFGQLVSRHTDRVYSTCLRILGDSHAARDATQAAFLVLVRRARQIPRDAALGWWLFWVARNCALGLKREGARRARREREAAMMRERESSRTPSWENVCPQIDSLLASLPRREQESVVLHYFYGKSQTEIAREAGCSQVMVSKRLAGALAKLRRKLSGRGLQMSAPVLVTLLGEHAVGLAPAGLAASVQAVCLGKAAAPSLALSTAEGTVKAMLWAKIKLAAAALAAAAAVGTGGTMAVRHFASTEAATQPPPRYRDKLDLLYYLDAEGRRHPVKTPQDWEKRREHILANMQLVMGKLPGEDRKVPLDVRVLKTSEGEGVTEKTITFAAEKGDRVQAYLHMPTKLKGLAPAMLWLHRQNYKGGQREALMAAELARRGYVVLAPDYPGYGTSEANGWTKVSRVYELGYASATMKGIWNHMRAVDLLTSLPEVDPGRIGVIGHGLGGHNALFLAAFDTRIKVIVSIAGFDSFSTGAPRGAWSGARYMPRIKTVYEMNAQKIPFDFPEVIGAIAPRHLFLSAPTAGGAFGFQGVPKCVRAARPVYELLGTSAAERILAMPPDDGRELPADVREAAGRFVDGVLKVSGARQTRSGDSR